MSSINTYCIEFEREIDGKEVIHCKGFHLPSEKDAVMIIQDFGYEFKQGYDRVNNIYQV